MPPVPSSISGARVIYASRIDGRHKPTGGCRHIIKGSEVGPVPGLAICQYDNDDGFYLFRCNKHWKTVTDTWHGSIDHAKSQAEFEYQGVSKTWIKPGAT